MQPKPSSCPASTRLLGRAAAGQTTGTHISIYTTPYIMKGPVSHSRKSREALDHIMQWHVHIYLAIWNQEWLLVTDSTSSMYGPRTQMGAQQKETLGVLW